MAFVILFFIRQFDKTNRITKITLCMIIAGGISNLMERIFLGHVIDYINVSDLFKFPIFNLADIYIVVGWVLLVVITIIYSVKTKKN